MTRKHFVRVAQILSNIKDRREHLLFVLHFVEMFAEDNENFDEDRFKSFAKAQWKLTQEAK